MNKMQINPWGITVPWVERYGGPLKGILYRLNDGRMIVAEVCEGGFSLELNGRERIFPSREIMTKWVKAHFVK
mgnify:CR=1 FL=1